MKLGMLAGVLICTLGAGAHAAPGLTLSPNAPVLEKPKNVDPMSACEGALVTTEKTVTANFSNGAKFEIVKDEAGRPQSYVFTTPDGEQQTANVADYMSGGESAKAQVPEAVAKSAAYLKLRRQVAKSLKLFLGLNCKRLLVNPATSEKKLVEDSVKSPALAEGSEVSARQRYDGNDGIDIYTMFDDAGGFEGATDDLVGDMFESGMWDFADSQKGKELPACRDVVADCQATCTSIGTYGGGVVCGSLGSVAGVVLSIPIGFAVAAYCGGKVFVATAECKSGCQPSIIPCTR